MVKTQLRSPSRILPYYSPQRSKKESALMRKRRLQVAKGMVWGKNGCVWKWERILFVAAPVPSSWIKWVEVGTNVLWFLYIYVYIYIYIWCSALWAGFAESNRPRIAQKIRQVAGAPSHEAFVGFQEIEDIRRFFGVSINGGPPILWMVYDGTSY